MFPLSEQNHPPHNTPTKHRGSVFLFTLRIMRVPARLLAGRLRFHFHKKYKPAYRRAKLLFAIDLLLIGIVIILTVLTIWIFYQRLWEGRVLAISGSTGPAVITSGAPVTFTFSYENKGREPLDQVVLAVHLPPNFELLRTFPASFAARTSTLPIGTLAAGERGMAKLTGRLWGAVETLAPVLVTAAFTSPRRNRRIVVFEKFEFPVQNSVLATSFVMPNRLISGQAVPFQFSYQNNGSEPLSMVLVRPLLPQSATVRSSSPALSPQGDWRLGRVEPDESGEIHGSFELPLEPGSEIRLTMRTSIIRNEVELVQDEITIPGIISAAPLQISAATTATLAKPNTALPVDIHIQNTGDAPIRKVAVTLAKTSPAIDPDEFNAPVNVGDLFPAESKTISMLLPLRERLKTQDIGEGETDRELSVVIRPEATGLIEDELPITLYARGTETSLPFESPFVLLATARYFTPEGEQIGRGPLPPTVGKTTKYWITWELAPTTNELEGLLVRAKLPPQVEWTGRAHATVGRAPYFEPETRTVRWTIDRLAPTLPAGEPLVARFEAALTPTDALRGATPPLLEETNAQAFDRFTETQLSTSAGALTTALPADHYIRGRIRVP